VGFPALRPLPAAAPPEGSATKPARQRRAESNIDVIFFYYLEEK